MSSTALKGRQAIPLAQNLDAVLPIGIPLGWQPKTTERRFAVRRGGRFCYLDEEGQCLWAVCWTGPSRRELIDFIVTKRKQEHDKAIADLDRFLSGRLLVQLGGDWREDWERIESLRVLPRSLVLDFDNRSGFQLLSPNGKWEVWLGAAEYAVWSYWDGIVQIRDSLSHAADSTGLPRPLLKERAHSLLIAAVRMKAVFLDESVAAQRERT